MGHCLNAGLCRRDANKHNVGLILETPSWRANADRGAKLGYSADALATVNKQLVSLLKDIRNAYETRQTPIVISGYIGPRGDGYIPDSSMSVQEAEHYHRAQITTFADSAANLVTAITHPHHIDKIGQRDKRWAERIRGLRANASTLRNMRR
jgi:S-methylmethionine-dependent homocysteine/selenocysteine methylase